MVAWTQLAEQCCLDRLRVRCIRQLALALPGLKTEQGLSYSRYTSTSSYSNRSTTSAGQQRAVQALAFTSELQVPRGGCLGACAVRLLSACN